MTQLICYVHPARSKKTGRVYLSGFDRHGGRWWVLSPSKPGDPWSLKYDAPEKSMPDMVLIENPPLLTASVRPLIEGGRDDGEAQG